MLGVAQSLFPLKKKKKKKKGCYDIIDHHVQARGVSIFLFLAFSFLSFFPSYWSSIQMTSLELYTNVPSLIGVHFPCSMSQGEFNLAGLLGGVFPLDSRPPVYYDMVAFNAQRVSLMFATVR